MWKLKLLVLATRWKLARDVIKPWKINRIENFPRFSFNHLSSQIVVKLSQWHSRTFFLVLFFLIKIFTWFTRRHNVEFYVTEHNNFITFQWRSTRTNAASLTKPSLKWLSIGSADELLLAHKWIWLMVLWMMPVEWNLRTASESIKLDWIPRKIVKIIENWII